MIRLQVREFFEAQPADFLVDPHSDTAHYEALMAKNSAQILGPAPIFDIRSELVENGYALISTDLADFAPPTPTSLSAHYEGPYYAEAMLALVGQVVGAVQSLPHQNDGRAFHDIMPIQAFRDKQTSGSSDVTLEMHTELAFVENPPDYLMLFCVRQDQTREAETHLYDSRYALNLLTADQYTRLTTVNYRVGLDANITGDVEDEDKPFAIFDGPTAKLLRYDIDLYQPVGQPFDEAFEALTQALLAMRIAVRLRPGQLIIVDNKRIVHSRSQFKATYDGKDRWLKRALVRGI
ncbi:TauD/TfdA family dioxygenase [Phyllobacterium sp. 22229]|uniref:TauD/TfdA family dioxygenase n=1 Tax=Hyphomicrobiales TaxID=356 RepID=UPI003369C9A4